MLTGDALFIGDVGRPDLLASIGVTADELGMMLYDSIQHKLMGLPDAVRVFPAHGAGSACGKNLSTEKQSTIGEQRTFNYACQPMTEEQFLAVVTAGQPPAPEYFVYNAILNRQERDTREVDAALPPLSPEEADGRRRGRRSSTPATPGVRRRSPPRPINVPVDGRMAETVGMVVQPDAEIVLVAPDGQEQEAGAAALPHRLRRAVGFLPRPEALLDRPPGPGRARQPAHPGQLDEALAVRSTCSWSTSATTARPRAARSQARCTSRSPSWPPGGRARPGHARRSSTAPAAGAPAWAAACCATGFTDVSDVLGGFAGWQATHHAAA